MLAHVLHIGALAMMEDRVHELIDRTERELYPQLERFKRMFQKHKLSFDKSTQKGAVAEDELVRVLDDFIERRGWGDVAQNSGTMIGALPRNKTGDILCTLALREDEGMPGMPCTIGIEVKFDSSIAMGDPAEQDVLKGATRSTGGFKSSNFDTAWSQLLETRANRACPFSIIVFDRSKAHSSILQNVSDVRYLPAIPGMIVVVDSQAGDYRNMLMAYELARDLARYHMAGEDDLDPRTLELLVGRFVQLSGAAQSIAKRVAKHTKETIKLNKSVQSEAAALVEMAAFTRDYLRKYLEDRKLNAKDMLEFYYAVDAKKGWHNANEQLEQELKALLAQ